VLNDCTLANDLDRQFGDVPRKAQREISEHKSRKARIA